MQALAIIDMQRWMFRTPERAAQLPALVPTVNRLVAECDAAGHPVFDVRVFHQADRSTWSRPMLKYDYPCMIEGTADVELVDGLEMPMAARHVRKTANSAFYGTNFEEQLRALGVDELLLAGAFIDGCVGLTAADAAQRGFGVVLVENAIAHCNARYRATLFEWLFGMYELTTITAGSVRAASAKA